MPPQVQRTPQRPQGAPTSSAPNPILPIIPEGLELHPLTAALLTVTAFLDLAENEVEPAAAGRVLERVGYYAQRLSDDELDELTVDLERLTDYAREQGWPDEACEFLDNFLVYCGFERGEGDEEDDELEQGELEDDELEDDELEDNEPEDD